MEKAPTREDYAKGYPNTGFNKTQHLIALEKWAEKAQDKIKALEHYKNTTVGLWATDKPELIIDESKTLFKLE